MNVAVTVMTELSSRTGLPSPRLLDDAIRATQFTVTAHASINPSMDTLNRPPQQTAKLKKSKNSGAASAPGARSLTYKS